LRALDEDPRGAGFEMVTQSDEAYFLVLRFLVI
jgi:hypothetical protein